MDEGFGLDDERVAEADQCVVQARSGCSSGDVEEFRDLHEGQPEVVVQDEDRALLDGESGEGALQFISVDDPVGRVGRRRPVDGQDPNRGAPLPGSPRLVVTGMDEDPMDPGLEAIGLTQARELPPGQDEGVLQRVLGEGLVAQDPLSDSEERPADMVHQEGERFSVTFASLFDEASLHLDPPVEPHPSGADYPL